MKEYFLNQIKKEMIASGLDFEKAQKKVEKDSRQYGFYNEEYFRSAYEQLKKEFEVENITFAGNVIKKNTRKSWYTDYNDSDTCYPPLLNYLRGIKGWPDKTITSINESSRDVVRLLDNPGQPKFTTKGLVLGYVQSGKTANMTAVIARAADVSYRFFIVLSGLTNALRKQTQERLEQDLIKLNRDKWHLLTNRDDDFRYHSDRFPPFSPSHRYIAVIKKNSTILKRLLKTLGETPILTLSKCPILIIDDECDQASVNSARLTEEMTAINSQIRKIIDILPRVAYVGYTATPFANVLISPHKSVVDDMDDLYPEDFIYALPRPGEYFGAEKLFGRDIPDSETGDLEDDGLDMIRLIDKDEKQYLQPKNSKSKSSFSFSVTESLEKAILYFLMAASARQIRGQEKQHCGMLVHTTTYVSPHFSARDAIKNFVSELHFQLKAGDNSLKQKMNKIWDEECTRVPAAEFGNLHVSFEQIWSEFDNVLQQIEVIVENGVSDERLDFSQPGKKYIVVGGSVLARGLTLEGLIVSFFLRSSSQYDSLMQMGRWFGYRKGFEDLPRVWMTSEIKNAFYDLSTVEAEIREDIKGYRRNEITPLEFAVRIRQIPGMAITARNKMRFAQQVSISYSDSHIQTRRFRHHDQNWLMNNWDAGTKLLNEVSENGINDSNRGKYITDVPFIHIKDFLNTYRIHETHEDMNKKLIIEYVEDQNNKSDNSLALWNIGIILPRKGNESKVVLGTLGKVKTVVRSRLTGLTSTGDADIKALMSREDIFIDSKNPPTKVRLSWPGAREIREKEYNKKPLLLFYPINAKSEPRSGGRTREPLNAVTDVLGIGIVFPRAEKESRLFVSVELPDVEFEEPENEEIGIEDGDQ